MAMFANITLVISTLHCSGMFGGPIHDTVTPVSQLLFFLLKYGFKLNKELSIRVLHFLKQISLYEY